VPLLNRWYRIPIGHALIDPTPRGRKPDDAAAVRRVIIAAAHEIGCSN
jgi:hypothetical protein